ncbi:hypothetical protein E0Z10_g10382 [Xylaria hypoxylon]|uniref:Uncharacterized protein n=1 Tax=Xylaria hypoxylon TaxID=37992 RepID=A0A4Z0YGL5_9PEZI|nr:hypothetical protein E0Z10_g10382 [Xylaria hypoxylon]
MAVIYRSFFSYNITRPYPFKWFTPVVIVGGIIAIVLVSFLNVATTGYELVQASSLNPNATEAARDTWFSNWPRYLIGARASCDASSMQVQSTLYTTKQIFPWRLESIGRVGDSNPLFGSLVYKNNLLQKCNVSIIRIEFETLDRNAGQIAEMPVGGTIGATAKCRVDNGDETSIVLETTYDIVPATETSDSFTGNNQLSIYWGYSLLQIYWRSLMQTFLEENQGEAPFSKGIIRLRQNTTLSGSIEEQLKNPDFLSVASCFFTPLNATGVVVIYNQYCGTHQLSALADSAPAFERPLPGIWRSVEILAKAIFFTVLADFGRNDDAMPNMLAHPDLLAILSSNLTAVNDTLGSAFRWGIHTSVIQKSFDPSRSQSETQQLGVNDSMLATDYLCQVPRLKSAGTLFLSVLVADLVILQAIWKIYTLVANSFLPKDNDKKKQCNACTCSTQDEKGTQDHQSIPPEERKHSSSFCEPPSHESLHRKPSLESLSLS